MPLFDTEIADRVQACGNVAVLLIDNPDHAVPLARALYDGGVTVMEPTLRTPAGMEAIRRIARELPQMLVGAGTVITPQQAKDAAEAGASFAVSPGFNPHVVLAATEAGLSFAPGVMTPSDVEAAIEIGCNVLKFFPAEAAGGTALLKSMAAPYNHLGLRYIPTGGLKAENTPAYLKLPIVAACGGSWIAPRDLIAARDWTTIRANAEIATAMVATARA